MFALYRALARNTIQLLLHSCIRVRPYGFNDGEFLDRAEDGKEPMNDTSLRRKNDNVCMRCRKRDGDFMIVRQERKKSSDSSFEELGIPIWEFSLQHEALFKKSVPLAPIFKNIIRSYSRFIASGRFDEFMSPFN